MSRICLVERTLRYAGMRVRYRASCAGVITEAPPLEIALMIVGSGSRTLSRLGPAVPCDFAALSLWQTPQVLTKSGFPAAAFPTILGFAGACASASAGTPAAIVAAAAGRQRCLTSMLLSIAPPRQDGG